MHGCQPTCSKSAMSKAKNSIFSFICDEWAECWKSCIDCILIRKTKVATYFHHTNNLPKANSEDIDWCQFAVLADRIPTEPLPLLPTCSNSSRVKPQDAVPPRAAFHEAGSRGKQLQWEAINRNLASLSLSSSFPYNYTKLLSDQ